MRYTFAILILIFPRLYGETSDTKSPSSAHNIKGEIGKNIQAMSNRITIGIGEKIFTATLHDNNSATAFKSMLPLTITMTELNENEKYFQLSKNLPTNSSNPGTIKSGDLMLWGSNTLVLFYKTFSTSYNYTKLGSVDNPTDLAGALGTGNRTIVIRLAE